MWNAIDWLSIISKSDLSDKMKWDFIQTVIVSIYGCTTRTKCLVKKMDSNYTRMLRGILKKKKCWKQHITKQQVYSNLPLISQTIRPSQRRHCRISKDGLISHGLLHMDVPMLADQQRLTKALCGYGMLP